MGEQDTAGYACSVATKAKLKTAPKISGYPVYLWNDDNKVNSHPAIASNQLSATNQLIYSPCWRQAVVALWGALDVVIDAYTYASLFKTIIACTLLLDVQFAHANLFCISTDSGAQ